MRLSEAIRLGALLKPQAYEGPSTVGVSLLASRRRTCALEAAAEAVGDRALDIFDPVWNRRWPHSKNMMACPACRVSEPMWLTCVIAHLNDMHRWTREWIADWVETIEPPEPRRSRRCRRGRGGGCDVSRVERCGWRRSRVSVVVDLFVVFVDWCMGYAVGTLIAAWIAETAEVRRRNLWP